jgi:hypothetical protein
MIIRRSPKLVLTVLDGQKLAKGEFVTLNAMGVENRRSGRMNFLSLKEKLP